MKNKNKKNKGKKRGRKNKKIVEKVANYVIKHECSINKAVKKISNRKPGGSELKAVRRLIKEKTGKTYEELINKKQDIVEKPRVDVLFAEIEHKFDKIDDLMREITDVIKERKTELVEKLELFSKLEKY